MSRTTATARRCLWGVAAALLALFAGHSQFFHHLERKTVDFRLRFAARTWPPAPDITVIALDDESLSRLGPEFGRWPWPRRTLADVIRYCESARSVGVDIILPERDTAATSTDDELIEAVRSHGRVVLATHLDERSTAPAPPQDALSGVVPGEHWLRHRGQLMPFHELAAAAAGSGFVNCLDDDDGVLRSAVAAAVAGEIVSPSLPLAMALHLPSHGGAAPAIQDGALRVAGRSFPLDAHGRFFLAPRSGPYATLSMADVLAASRAAQDRAPDAPGPLDGRLVLIGSTATGLQDDRQMTSMGRFVPGAHIMASALDQLLHGPAIRASPFGFTVIITLLLALFPALLGSDRPGFFGASLIAVTVLYAGAAWVSLAAGHVLIPVIVPLLATWLGHGALGSTLWGHERRRRADMEALEGAKQQFTDMLVHDLRNQTGPIMMAISLLEQRAEKRGHDEEVRWARTAHASTARLVSQIDNLLDIRRIEEGRMQLRRASHALAQLVREAIAQYQPAVDRATMRLVLQAPPEADAWRVNADADLLNRVFGNLFWNAVKYGREGTDIEIAVQRDAAGMLSVAVGNRGEPIPAEDQGRLFAPFSMLSRKRSALKFRGSGLGLAFCRLAVEAHGGRIQLESPWRASGDGVLVRISLPAAERA